MEIRKYLSTDSQELFALMSREGEDWTYNTPEHAANYQACMERSIAFVAVEARQIIGYIRCKNDDGFGIYVLDLLVDKKFRGQNLGRRLIDEIVALFPDAPIYITSDADGYYEKQGFSVVGTVFEVQ